MSERKNRLPIAPARLTTPATLLVCTTCDGGADLRRRIKRELTDSGRKRALRVVRCGCLDVCPKRGSAAVLVATGVPARSVVIADDAVVDGAFVRRLLDERMGDAVADEDRSRDGRFLDHGG